MPYPHEPQREMGAPESTSGEQAPPAEREDSGKAAAPAYRGIASQPRIVPVLADPVRPRGSHAGSGPSALSTRGRAAALDRPPGGPAAPTERIQDLAAGSPAKAAGKVRATILVVENEDSNLRLTETILSFAGYRCITARDGREAVEMFDRERPDLVLTDIAMPVMDGYQATESMRARPRGAKIPIVAVTAHAMSGDREQALRRGCDEYLAKPYRPRHLLEVVERLLREAGT